MSEKEKIAWHRARSVATVVLAIVLLAGCGIRVPGHLDLPESPIADASPLPSSTSTPVSTQAPTPRPTSTIRNDGLSEAQARTLGSVEQVDPFPLYTMRYVADYARATPSLTGENRTGATSMWACSLFAALGDAKNSLYGRNFDWEFSPALLLFTDPPDGYASVSMVDIAYMGFAGDRAHTVLDLPLGERVGLLDAPFWPFDGMNEAGVVVGMAAVPGGGMRADPAKETVGSLGVIREMLDNAGDVDEAVAILESYNIDFRGGPDLHYLIADRSGRAALVEFYQGERVVTYDEAPWHVATNFLRASAGGSPEGTCRRYDRIQEELERAGGGLEREDGLRLLEEVAQQNTQWSVVYGLASGGVDIVMGRKFDTPRSFDLDSAGQAVAP